MHPTSSSTVNANGQKLDRMLSDLEARSQAFVSAWSSNQTETTSVLQAAIRLEEAVKGLCTIPQGSYNNHEHQLQLQSCLLTSLQEVAACFSKTCDQLFIDNPGDNDSAWATATEHEAADYLEPAKKPLLQAVTVLLRTFSNAMPVALQGLTLQQDHADKEFVDTNQATPVSEPPTVDSLLQEVSSISPASRLHGKHRNAATPRVVIEVLDSTTNNPVDKDTHNAAAVQTCSEAARMCVKTIVLACVTWHSGPQLPCPYALPESHKSEDTGTRRENDRLQADQVISLALLQATADSVQLPDIHNCGNGRSPASSHGLSKLDNVQRLVCWACVEAGLLPDLRRILKRTAAQEQPVVPLQQQVVAARQCAVLIRMIDKGAAASYMFPTALSTALAAVDAGSPAVAVHGMWALHHLVGTAPSTDVQWQSQLLLDTARKLLVGCQECVWLTACKTATAMTTAILGDDVRAVGYHTLMSDMLNEMERHAHQRTWRLAFLAPEVACTLIKSMKLTILRHTNRLLPLLLEWCQASDELSRTAAVQTLHVLLCHMWPRAPAHAATLWHHLSTLYLREAAAVCATRPAQHQPSRPADSRAACQDGPQQHAECIAVGVINQLDTGQNLGSCAVAPNQYVKELMNVSATACWAVKCCELLAYCGKGAYKQAVCDTATELQRLTSENHPIHADGSDTQPQTAASLVYHDAKQLPYAHGLIEHIHALLLHAS